MCADVCFSCAYVCVCVQVNLIFKFYCILFCCVISMLFTACNANRMVMCCGCMLRIKLLRTDFTVVYLFIYFHVVGG